MQLKKSRLQQKSTIVTYVKKKEIQTHSAKKKVDSKKVFNTEEPFLRNQRRLFFRHLDVAGVLFRRVNNSISLYSSGDSGMLLSPGHVKKY